MPAVRTRAVRLVLGLAFVASCGGHAQHDALDEGAAGAGGVSHGISSGGGPRPGDVGGSTTGFAGTPSAAGASVGGGASTPVAGAGGSLGEGGSGGAAVTCVEPDGVTITSEPELVDFAARGCEVLEGTLTIEASSLANFDALEPSTLRIITGSLVLRDNAALENIDGLSGIEQVNRSLVIENHVLLADIDGLSTLQSLGTESESNSLVIGGNDALVSIAPLELVALKGMGVMVSGNPLLVTVSLQGLVNSGYIIVAVNDALESLTLPNLETATSSFTIASNPKLASLSLPLLQTASNFAVTAAPALVSFDLPNLESVEGSLTFAENTLLESFGALAALTQVDTLAISSNPKLPACEANALATRLGVSCSCGGNDETAICN